MSSASDRCVTSKVANVSLALCRFGYNERMPLTSRDIVRIARQRAGLTQQQLADRSGHPRETIARWETGAREPSLATLQELAAASDLDLVVHLARRDPSLADDVADQLELSPTERLERLLPAATRDDTVRALRWLAAARTPVIVIGAVAGVLQGAPQRPGSGWVEFVSGDPFAMDAEMREGGLTASDTDERWADVDARALWTLPEGGTLALASNVPGTGDYADLRRSIRTVELDGETRVPAAHPRDLLRMADASPRDSERARAPGLRALLDRVSET
jgi:transcriptional regulator with XRE-family HTH domain